MMLSQGGEATTPGHKLLAAPAIKVRIAVACGLVLAMGAWLTPRVAPTPLSAPQEHAAPLLEEQVQLREVVRPFHGVQDVAARLRGHGVAISQPEAPTATKNDFLETTDDLQPAGFGVFVSDIHVLTHAAALNGRSTSQVLTADRRGLQAKAVAYEPSTGLVLLQTEPFKAPAVAMATSPPEPGTLAVAAGPWEERDIAVPIFVTSIAGDRYTVGGGDGALLPGMPVYSLDGELVAIAAGPGGVAFPVRGAADRLVARASAGEPQVSFGIGFQELRGLLTRIFGETGVLINHVVVGGPADLAGLQAGDVLVAIGDVEIDSTDTAARALTSAQLGTATTVRVLRNGRERRFEAMPALSYEVAALARAGSDANVSAPEARLLFAPSLLDRAGIPANARVLAINGRTVSSRAQADRELRRSRNLVPVLLRQGDKRFFETIDPAR
jgi:serine protease Do